MSNSIEAKYLAQNIDILAVAAGFNRAKFLEKCRIHPSTLANYFWHHWCLSDKHVTRIDEFIKGAGGRWLKYIYKRAKKEVLVRTDLLKAESKVLPDLSPRAILTTNQRALRYFLELRTQDIARAIHCSKETVSSIETGLIKVSDDRCEEVFNYLGDYANANGPRKQYIFTIGSFHRITTVIPKYVRF